MLADVLRRVAGASAVEITTEFVSISETSSVSTTRAITPVDRDHAFLITNLTGGNSVAASSVLVEAFFSADDEITVRRTDSSSTLAGSVLVVSSPALKVVEIRDTLAGGSQDHTLAEPAPDGAFVLASSRTASTTNAPGRQQVGGHLVDENTVRAERIHTSGGDADYTLYVVMGA